MRDKLFQDPGRRLSSFDFDEDVAAVFDDMLQRSIPFYPEIQNMIADLADALLPQQCTVFDLGCSTGTTIALLAKRLDRGSVDFIGVDSSAPMLEKAKNNLAKLQPVCVELIEHDLNKGMAIKNADLVVMNLVLQFIQPENRARLLRNIFEGLNASGALILVEKIVAEDESMNNVFIDAYHSFKKRNLYTDQEIAAKRKALENRLIPNRMSDNQKLLRQTGFARIEVFFQWFNFCGLIAIKD